MPKPKHTRTLTIHIETDRTGPRGLPLLTWSPGELPIVRATVVLDNAKDSKGSTVIIRSHVSVETRTRDGRTDVLLKERKETLSLREWRMDIISSKPGYIAQGSYTKAIQWTLDPSWPSSFDQYEVSQQGWVRYCISATMDKLPSGFLSALGSYAIMQEFWVVLPGADVLDPSIPPEVHFPIAEPQAHLSCFTPSNRLHLDEVVPLTFRFAPPASLTEGPGQGEPPATWTIERADIELKQISNYYPSGPDSLEVLSLVIAEVPIHSGWPAPGGSIEPWERVVYMVVPGFEKSATSFTSRYLHVRHQIKVKVVLRSSASPKTVLWKHKFDVNINGIKVLPPSIEASGEAEFLPEYTAE